MVSLIDITLVVETVLFLGILLVSIVWALPTRTSNG